MVSSFMTMNIDELKSEYRALRNEQSAFGNPSNGSAKMLKLAEIVNRKLNLRKVIRQIDPTFDTRGNR